MKSLSTTEREEARAFAVRPASGSASQQQVQDWRESFSAELGQASPASFSTAPWFPVATILILLLNLVTAANAAPQVPPSVLELLSAGQPQELLVLFDASGIDADAEQQRISKHLAYNDASILAVKASRFASLKSNAFSLLPKSEFDILRTYDHLPMSFLRFHTLASLNALIYRPEVVAVYENEWRFISNDPAALTLINQPAAAAAGLLGTGATVAVIDTGVDYTLPDFGSCSAPASPFSCRVIDVELFSSESNPKDYNGHGTAVADIVLQAAPNVRVAALHVFSGSPPVTYDVNVIDAINWSIGNRDLFNVVAMNMSLGSGLYSSPCTGLDYDSPIAEAKSAGILAAVASGNDGSANSISAPACEPGAVSVGATDKFGNVATTFSNSAPFLTMLAPGVNIYSTGPDSGGDGTSFATPFVAGAAAVLRGAYPAEDVDSTVARMTTRGTPTIDPRNGVRTPLLDIWAASLPSPTVQFGPQLHFGVGSYPYGLAEGDFNGDGKPDLAIANYYSNAISVFLSDGSGGFAPPSTVSVGTHPAGVVAGKFDSTGNPYLAVANQADGTISILQGSPSGVFTPLSNAPMAISNPQFLAVGDFRHHGTSDIVVGNYGGTGVSVFLGNGNGTFQSGVPYTTGSGALWPAVGDFDHDGKLDVAVTNYNANTVSVLIGNGDGTFKPQVPYATGNSPEGIAVADLNGDGYLDLVVTNVGSGTISIFLNNGDGSFAPQIVYPVGNVPYAVAVADLNRDGYPDIIVTNRDSSTVGVLFGNSHHTFQSQVAYNTPGKPEGLVVADFNGDGLPDLALTSLSSNEVAILLNLTDRIFANGFQ